MSDKVDEMFNAAMHVIRSQIIGTEDVSVIVNTAKLAVSAELPTPLWPHEQRIKEAVDATYFAAPPDVVCALNITQRFMSELNVLQ